MQAQSPSEAHSVTEVPPVSAPLPRRTHHRWFPNQKGAWIMALVPFLSGGIGGGFTWQHLLLLALWLAGYSLFFAGTQWLTARQAARLRPPVLLWAGITAVLGLINLWFCGALIIWIVLFVPLIAVAVWAAQRRRARTLSARSAEVIAAGLMCLVAWDAGVRIYGPFGAEISDLGITPAADITLLSLSQWGPLPTLLLSPAAPKAIAVTVALTYYFWSTIPFVKSLVRERDSQRYLRLSTCTHGIGLLAALLSWALQIFDWRLPLMWLILLGRWAYFTRLSRSPHTASLNQRQLLMIVGFAESVLSILYMGAALA
ncbi:MAG: YwiC-like family protein [Arcanobacterium sp.]|nr:YwiC-like family protein [Arcanobacterium sp.]